MFKYVGGWYGHVSAGAHKDQKRVLDSLDLWSLWAIWFKLGIKHRSSGSETALCALTTEPSPQPRKLCYNI